MSHHTRDLKGGRAFTKNGNVYGIKSVDFFMGDCNTPGFFLKTQCGKGIAYTYLGKLHDDNDDLGLEIVKLEFSKTPKYKVFKTEKFADLDILIEIWDDYAEVVDKEGNTLYKKENGIYLPNSYILPKSEYRLYFKDNT